MHDAALPPGCEGRPRISHLMQASAQALLEGVNKTCSPMQAAHAALEPPPAPHCQARGRAAETTGLWKPMRRQAVQQGAEGGGFLQPPSTFWLQQAAYESLAARWSSARASTGSLMHPRRSVVVGEDLRWELGKPGCWFLRIVRSLLDGASGAAIRNRFGPPPKGCRRDARALACASAGISSCLAAKPGKPLVQELRIREA